MPIHRTFEGWWVMDQDINRTKAIEHISHDIAWEPGLVEFALQGIQPGKTVVDIGAHIGDTAVPFIRAGAPVVAYEPDPLSFTCLTRNCPEALVYNLALSNYKGPRDFTRIIRDSPNWESGRLARPWEAPSFTVMSYTLDEHRKQWTKFPEIGFIKIDVDGGEYDVLLGAIETISNCRPNILVEVSSQIMIDCGNTWQPIKEFLDGFGYSYSFFPEGTLWESTSTDVLCLFPKR
jgi:FkbM family methyltransferase